MYTDLETFGRILRILHSPRTFSLRRLLVLDTLFGIISGLNVANYVGEWFDERDHAEYHDIDVGAPIYLVAAPRSGTTFLHRLMALDPRFVSFKLSETLLTTISAQEAIDRRKARGGAFAKAVDAIKAVVDQQTFSGWDGLHDTGLDEDEEDEGIWTLAMATPAVFLVLPFPDEFEHLRFVDRLPEHKRRKLVEHYRACLQRRLYRNPGKTLLMKNVLIPGRFELVHRAVPDARFVHIVRHPYEAIPSSLSLFTLPWSFLAPELYGPSPQTRDFAELMIDYYRFLHDEERRRAEDGVNPFVVLRYEDVVSDPVAQVRRVYDGFGLPFSAELEATLRADLARRAAFKSAHNYSLEQFGLTRAYIDERLGDVMDYYGFAR